MNINNSDDQFFKLLRDVSRTGKRTPPLSAWDNIFEKLPKKKRRFLPWMTFMAGGIAILITSVLLYYFEGNKVNIASDIKDKEGLTSEFIMVDSNFLSRIPEKSLTNSESVNKNKFSDLKSSKRDFKSTKSISNKSNINSKLQNKHSPTITKFENGDEDLNETLNDFQEISTVFTKVGQAIILDNKHYSVDNFQILDFQPSKLPLCPTIRKKVKPDWFVEIYAGGGIPYKSMELVHPNQQEIYNLRSETEMPWYTWNFGGMVGVKLRNNFSFSLGGRFTQIKDIFSFEKEAVQKLIIDFDYYGVPIDTTIIRGSVVEKGENRHTIIDIPVMIGYTIKMNKNWSFQLDAGAVINLSLNSDGKIMTGLDAIEKIDNLNPYRESIGLGLLGGLSLQRKVSEQSILYLRPDFRYSMQDWNKTDEGIRMSYNTLSMNVGYRIYF